MNSTRVKILLLKVMPKPRHLPSSLQLITTLRSAPQMSAFTDLAVEFSTSDKTGPAVDEKLASIVNDLCTDNCLKQVRRGS